MIDFFEEVYKLTRQIPKGRVSTYGAIAKALGDIIAARAVGFALNLNPDLDYTPCYKVVNSNGTIGGFALGLQEKIRRLKDDGIEVKDNRIVNFEKIFFDDFKTNYPLKQLRKKQIELRGKVSIKDEIEDIKKVAGIDIAYSKKDSKKACGAYVTIDSNTMEVLESNTIITNINFPYIPTYLAYRELPIFLKLFDKMKIKPDVIMVDGNGILHPFGIGIASHIGILLDIPTVGVAKKLLYGKEKSIRLSRKNVCEIVDEKGKIIGFSLRVYENVKPVFVSPGHKISFRRALDITRKVQKYRIPEPIRRAHIIAREKIKN
jgi:deoxyribonuclease V